MTRLTEALSERDWQRQVLDLATLRRWTWYHTHDSRRSPAGFPDLVLVRDRVIYAELKTDKGRLTTNQLAWQRILAAAGAEVYVWRPRDWDAVKVALTTRRNHAVPALSGAAEGRSGVR